MNSSVKNLTDNKWRKGVFAKYVKINALIDN